ncbi:TetR family transcriptional regulator [Lentzea sp. NBRC 105346]|uniref:TetR/AcrR family transcriptional regulator n=1 Tax=Lentzea sp. NBRC 105346 TaxID=3032205 RepID=UPI0024A4D518|nr:TetR/AcrR family transcriptional regulator C-terminal domain-containing protein [Lentzea sp. NBRC 105346]GLZ32989.1 TetR family transcriptional regulator [Lentzea sp. NBRC 105346]
MLVWERPEPPSKPTPSPLSREKIVRAAITLADADGLVAVSFRKVAAELNAGPMRLYGYVETKDELLDLMVDAVYGEISPPQPGDGWRSALQTVARSLRQAALRHDWFSDLLGGRPHMGPNALAFTEASLVALDGAPEFDHIDDVMGAVGTVRGYVIGAVRNEISEARAERASGMNERQWQTASGPYIERMLATGRFPMLARVVHEATHPDADTVFEGGLELILDGIEARLTKRSPG